MKFFKTVKQSVSEFIADSCMSSGAAIAYYAIFALPPLVMIVYALVGYLGISQQQINEAAQKRLGIPTAAASGSGAGKANGSTTEESGGAGAGEAAGEGAAKAGDAGTTESGSSGGEGQAANGSAFGKVAERTKEERVGFGSISGIAGTIVLLFTATGLFSELQFALNRAWGVKPDPDQGGIRRFLIKRLFSLGLIAIMALLLLASVLLSALLGEIYSYFQGAVPSGMQRIVSAILDHVITFVVATLLFAAIFKILPDVDIQWRDMWVGAASTALLFVIGKALISWYLQRSDLGASWGGAVASLIAVLAWLYYTSLIVLLGAEFTQVWARQYGHGFNPSEGAQDTGKASSPSESLSRG